MSSMKYDDDTCSTIISSLEKVSLALADVESALSSYYSNNSGLNGTIDARVDKLSEETDQETGETYRDYSKYNYYNGRVANPLKSAISNISILKNAVAGYKGEIEDVKGNLSQVSTLVDEYENSDTTIPGLGDKTDELPTLSTKYTEETVYDKRDLTEEGQKKEIRVDVDTDGDGKPDLNVDTNKDGVPDVNIDTNEDGKPDLNIDTNKDGVPDINIDLNQDGKPDLNIDTNSDGTPDVNIDINQDGKPDLNIDTNNDGTPDTNIDLNQDGKPDLNIDTNNDGVPDVNIDTNNDGEPDLNIDTNNDGVPDLNVDTNGDGKPDLNIDTNGDGKADKNIDADGDGEIDPVVTTPKGDDTGDEGDKGDDPTTPQETLPPKSDVFDEDDAGDTKDGFADNIVAGVTPGSEGDTGTPDGNGSNGSGGAGGIWGTSANGDGSSGEAGLFPFLPGSSTSADGENSDLIYRGLYEQGDEGFDMNQIKYSAIGEDGSAVAKGAAVVGAVGLGVSGVDAVATINENRKQSADTMSSSEEKEEKKLIKTIVSSSILGLVSIGYIIALLIPNSSMFAIILLGVAMAVSSVTATSGLKIGKYIGFGAVLFVSLLTFILSSLGVILPIGYVVVFATYVILSIAAVLLDLLKGMFDDKLELVPIIIAIAVGLFFGMLKVLNIINWILLVVFLGLTVGGWFLWDKVIKYKLPDDDDDDEVVDNVIYKPVQYTENSPMNAPEQEKFDPRNLYKEDDAKNEAALSNMMNQQKQNPFANYNPQNSTFNNAFKDDNNNNNNGMF